MSAPTSREQQRDQLLEAVLVHVPFDGWSRRSLFAGAGDIGFEPGLARRLFARGGDDLLGHLDRWADRQMLARIDETALEAMPVRDRIAALIKTRLEVLTPHREAMRRANVARLVPSNALAAGLGLWRMVDLMWALAGDRADDVSYYTKRSLLAAVWTSTFLYWLEDRSADLQDTSAFLERRIDDVMRFGKLRGQIETAFEGLRRFSPLRASS